MLIKWLEHCRGCRKMSNWRSGGRWEFVERRIGWNPCARWTSGCQHGRHLKWLLLWRLYLQIKFTNSRLTFQASFNCVVSLGFFIFPLFCSAVVQGSVVGLHRPLYRSCQQPCDTAETITKRTNKFCQPVVTKVTFQHPLAYFHVRFTFYTNPRYFCSFHIEHSCQMDPQSFFSLRLDGSMY